MPEEPPKVIGRPMLTDENLPASDSRYPPWLRRPRGAPVYYGFPLIEETRTDGWCFGGITDFLHADSPEGCNGGDGFVEAPDGARAGLVWDVGDGPPSVVMPPEKGRWGVYQVWFPRPIRTIEDLVFDFRHVLPALKEIRARITEVDVARSAPEKPRKPRQFWRRRDRTRK